MHQRRDSLGLRHVDDSLDGILVLRPVVLVGEPEGDAHIVGANEDAVYARNVQDSLQVIHPGHALDADDGDAVPVALLQVRPRGVADVVPGLDDAVHRLALERAPLRGCNDFANLIDGLAIRSQHPLRSRVHCHGHVVRVRDGDPHDGHHPTGVEHSQVVAQFGPAARVVLRIDHRVVQPHPGKHRDPAWAVTVGNHRAENPPAFLQCLLELCAVHCLPSTWPPLSDRSGLEFGSPPLLTPGLVG